MNMPNESSVELVMVPVPAPALPQVYEALDRYYKGLDLGPADVTVAVPGNGDWSQTEIKQLSGYYRNPKGRAVIRKIAVARGAEVTYGELAEAGGLSFDELRDQLSWFAKYAKKIKEGVHIWPITVEDRQGKPKEERYIYRMPPEIADWWLEIDGGDDAK
ncbi:MAG: hypothetical protein JWO36_910 [Myxococcales bacterium]|nr:hypothetical protein [Myxococcales bacterium]